MTIVNNMADGTNPKRPPRRLTDPHDANFIRKCMVLLQLNIPHRNAWKITSASEEFCKDVCND